MLERRGERSSTGVERCGVAAPEGEVSGVVVARGRADGFGNESYPVERERAARIMWWDLALRCALRAAEGEAARYTNTKLI